MLLLDDMQVVKLLQRPRAVSQVGKQIMGSIGQYTFSIYNRATPAALLV